MKETPKPVPQLDGPPPSPPGVSAGAPAPSFGGLSPEQPADMSGGLQTVQLLLQTAQAVAQGLDILGQIDPNFSGISAQMQTMLREGVKLSLQQGLPGSEPSMGSPTFASMGGAV